MPEYLGANFHMCLYDLIQARRTAMLLSSNVAKLEKIQTQQKTKPNTVWNTIQMWKPFMDPFRKLKGHFSASAATLCLIGFIFISTSIKLTVHVVIQSVGLS